MNPPRPRRVRPVTPEAPASTPPPANDAAPSAPVEPRHAEPAAPPPARAAEPVVILPTDAPSTDTTAKDAADGQATRQRPSWMVDLGGKDVGAAVDKMRSDVGYWMQRGRYNKVRLTREGKSVIPDIPVGALMAAEIATLAWAGPLRTALVNVAGRLLFKVELINDAQEHLNAAREHYARGDLNEADTECVRALKVDPRMADGYLLLGTLAKVRGNTQEALRHLQRAHDLDPHGPVGRQAETAGRKIDPDFGAGGSGGGRPERM